MRISPRNEDRLVFYGLAVFVIILFIIMIRSTPANATVEEISIYRGFDLLMTMNDYDLFAEPEMDRSPMGSASPTVFRRRRIRHGDERPVLRVRVRPDRRQPDVDSAGRMAVPPIHVGMVHHRIRV